MTLSSFRNGHRQSSSLSLASRAAHTWIDPSLDDDGHRSSTSLGLGHSASRKKLHPHSAITAPSSSPRIRPRSLVRTRPNSLGILAHGHASESDSLSSGDDDGNDSGHNPTPRPPLSSQRTNSNTHRSQSSSVNVMIPRLMDSNSPSGHHHILHHSNPQTPNSMPSYGYGKIRFVLLAAGSFALFGNYYAFDNPAALNEPLREYMQMDVDTYAYFINLLYAVYSIPNIIMPWLGGYAADRFGHTRLLISMSITVALGHLVVCLGIASKNVGVMYLGRVLFGAGESLAVAQAAFTVKYFRGKELAMALGINLCVGRLGSVLNDILTPYIWRRTNVPTAFWAGFVSCVFSCISVFLLIFIDQKYGSGAPESAGFRRLSTMQQHDIQERSKMSSNDQDSLVKSSATSNSDSELGQSSSSHNVASISKYDPPLSSSILSLGKGGDGTGQHQEEIAMQKLHKHGSAEDTKLESEPEDNNGVMTPMDTPVHHAHLSALPSESMANLLWQEQLVLKVKKLLDYSQAFWILLIMIFVIVGVQVPFNSIHAGFLQMRWYHGDPEKAAQIMTVPDLLSSVLVLPLGFFVDYYGQKTWLFMLASLTVGFAHLTLGVFNPPSPIPALLALGIASAIGALFTSVIPALVKEHQVAQAYGMTSAAMNLAFTIFPLIVARLMTVDATVYTSVEIFFSCCGFTGFLLGVRLKYLDKEGVMDRKEIGGAPVMVH